MAEVLHIEIGCCPAPVAEGVLAVLDAYGATPRIPLAAHVDNLIGTWTGWGEAGVDAMVDLATAGVLAFRAWNPGGVISISTPGEDYWCGRCTDEGEPMMTLSTLNTSAGTYWETLGRDQTKAFERWSKATVLTLTEGDHGWKVSEPFAVRDTFQTWQIARSPEPEPGPDAPERKIVPIAVPFMPTMHLTRTVVVVDGDDVLTAFVEATGAGLSVAIDGTATIYGEASQ